MTDRLNEIFLADARERLDKAKTLAALSAAWEPYEAALDQLDSETLDALREIQNNAVIRLTGGGGIV
jgi:hypothetical protein